MEHWTYLRNLTAGQCSSEETSPQRLRAVGKAMSDLTGLGIEPKIPHRKRPV